MKFSFNKLKSALGGGKVSEEETEDYIATIIEEVEGKPFALSNTNVMYAGLSELAGYHYLKTMIIGTLQVKTFKGAKLFIKGIDHDLTLHSDMLEFESEPTNKSNQYLTRIDFELNSEDVKKISRKKVERLELTVKKNKVDFNIVEGDDEDLVEKHETSDIEVVEPTADNEKPLDA